MAKSRLGPVVARRRAPPGGYRGQVSRFWARRGPVCGRRSWGKELGVSRKPPAGVKIPWPAPWTTPRCGLGARTGPGPSG